MTGSEGWVALGLGLLFAVACHHPHLYHNVSMGPPTIREGLGVWPLHLPPDRC